MIPRTIARTLGRYQVIRRIGRGGMGDVWLCDDPRLHRQVAIKTLPVHNQQDLEFSQRFEREAQATAALSHPHILSIYDYGEQPAANGQVITYIVMPYIAGGSLADSIGAYQAQQRLMPALEAITYLAQAAEAIDYAHEQGIVHRDIKPGNMLLRNERWLLLTDFGIAHMLSSVENLTQTGVGIGTPEYMAPEQAQGKAGAASDIYSLAVVAYYLFTGRLPFNAETSYATTIQHMTLPPPPPRLFNPTLPPLFEAVLLHGLAKQPTERPFLARTFITDLQQAFPGMPSEISSTYATQVERPQTPIIPTSSYTTQVERLQTPTVPTSYTTQFWQPQTPTMPTVSTQDPTSMPTTQVERTTPGSESKSMLPFSRRQMIIGGGAALAVLGGGLGTWEIVSKLHIAQSSPAMTTLSVPPTPKPGPNGPDLILQGHLQPANSLAWSPKKNVLASIADQDDLLLWDITRHQNSSPDPIARRPTRNGSSMRLAWSPDGSMLALANTAEGSIGQDDATIDLYTSNLSNTASGFSTFITAEGTSMLAGLCWVNETMLVGVSIPPLNSNDDKHFRLWAMDVAQPQQRFKAISVAGSLGGTIDHNSPPVLAASADRSLVAIALFDTIVIGQVSIAANAIQWQLRTTLQFDKGSFIEPATVLWDPTGHTIGTFYVSNGSSLYLWDRQGNKNTPVKELDLDTDTTVTAMAWCPEPKSPLIATATSDGKVLIWNANKGTTPVATLNGGAINQKITALAWSTDGQWIAAGYNDNYTSILVWKTAGRGL